MKKWFLVGVALMLMVSLLVVGCGIPQKDYDAVVAERDAFANNVALLETARDAQNVQEAKIEATMTELETALDELMVEMEEVTEAVRERYERMKTLWFSLDAKLALQSCLFGWGTDPYRVLSGEMTEMQYVQKTLRFFTTASVLIVPVYNDEIDGYWDDFQQFAAQGNEVKMAGSLLALRDLLVELIHIDRVALAFDINTIQIELWMQD